VGRITGSGSGSSSWALAGRSSSRDMHRLKSGWGDDVTAFKRILITTSEL